MNPLDQQINDHFSGLVVRKDLVKLVKGNAIVPSYVLEYLLGQYCATSDEASIQSGVETVKEILRRHYVHLSPDPETASLVGGRRSETPVIIEVHARQAHSEGLAFYRGNDQVWLSDPIPPSLLRLPGE